MAKETIVAIVTTNKEKVLYSGPPVFYAESKEEAEKTAMLLSKITLAMIHDVENECFIIVQH
ncbi:hypothetical protein [Alkalibaculum bacchi]|uniref:capping complex subunit for YIEGIA n=1 Tax=Alkalibaculum bacchi TaxID=645887 RepID=UPI0026EA2C10|nr:hypothetical protein [Alkalibaculum bacchi]